MKKFDYLYSLLMELPPNLESIEKELKSDYINHENYTWKKSSDSTGQYEVEIVKKTTEV